jgi:hypothetical protein
MTGPDKAFMIRNLQASEAPHSSNALEALRNDLAVAYNTRLQEYLTKKEVPFRMVYGEPQIEGTDELQQKAARYSTNDLTLDVAEAALNPDKYIETMNTEFDKLAMCIASLRDGTGIRCLMEPVRVSLRKEAWVVSFRAYIRVALRY